MQKISFISNKNMATIIRQSYIDKIEKCITQPSRSLLLFSLNRKCGCRQSCNQQHFIHSFHKQHYLFKKTFFHNNSKFCILLCKNAHIRKYIDEHDALKKDVEKFQAQAVERAKDKLVAKGYNKH